MVLKTDTVVVQMDTARRTTHPCANTTRTGTVRCDHHNDDDPVGDNFSTSSSTSRSVIDTQAHAARARLSPARGCGASRRDRVRCAPHQQRSPRTQPIDSNLMGGQNDVTLRQLQQKSGSRARRGWSSTPRRMSIGRAEAAARARHGTAAGVGDSGRASGRTSRRRGKATSHCDCRLPASFWRRDRRRVLLLLRV